MQPTPGLNGCVRYSDRVVGERGLFDLHARGFHDAFPLGVFGVD